MKKKNEIFFALNKEPGITQTSANHIANIAKEFVRKIEEELTNINLVTSEVSLLGSSDNPQVLKHEMSVEDFNLITQKAEAIAKYNSLIAWLREAIKAKEEELCHANGLDIHIWAEANGQTIPGHPQKNIFGYTTFDEILGELSIKERNNYFFLETTCAVLGKLIHPDGSLSKARKEHTKRSIETSTISGSGRDSIITSYTTAYDSEEIEKVFFDLQNKHRESQAQLNKIKFDIEQKVTETNIKANDNYTVALQKYNSINNELLNLFNIHRERKRNEISKLKIVIPDSLIPVFEELNNIGK